MGGAGRLAVWGFRPACPCVLASQASPEASWAGGAARVGGEFLTAVPLSTWLAGAVACQDPRQDLWQHPSLLWGSLGIGSHQQSNTGLAGCLG